MPSWSSYKTKPSGQQRGYANTTARFGWGESKGKAIAVKNQVFGTGGGLMGKLASAGESIHKRTKSGATIFVIISFLLFIFDIIVDYKGFYITGVDAFGLFKTILSFGYIVGVWAIFFLLVSRNKSPGAIFSNVVLLVVLMITTGLVFKFNGMALIHMFFILFLWFFYLRDQKDVIKSNKILLTFIFLDLYLFSILQWLYSAGLIPLGAVEIIVGFPFLFMATNIYVWEKSDNRLAEVFIFLAFGYYFLMGGPAIAEKLALADFEGVREGIPSLGEMYSGFKTRIIQEPIEKISTATRAWLTGRIEYAITGKVEENQYEPLGVYLERVQSAEPRFYDEEDVVVWGSVKGRTLDDPINIKVGCYVKDDDKKIYADVVEPDKKFSVFAMEEQDFACRFNKCLLEDNNECILNEGSNFIKTFADFNFETLGYLKVYFINRERRRAMVREGLDVFKQFDIRDTKPAPIYTNGPAEIGMETTGPLISVSDSYSVYPRFSLSIQNRKGWEGTIKELKELVLFFPKGVELEVPDEDAENPIDPCNKKFIPYKIDKQTCTDEFQERSCDACKDESCKEFVYDDCAEICDIAGVPEPEYKEIDGKWEWVTNSDERCIKECVEETNDCVGVCDSLFNEGEETYKGYSLDLSDVKVRDEFKDFEKFKRFNCRFNPIPDDVLGNTPITTKFFRVKARYNYTVEKPVTVNIEKLPGPSGGDPDMPPTTPGGIGTADQAKKVRPIYTAMKNAIDNIPTRCIMEYGSLDLGDDRIRMIQDDEDIKFQQILDGGNVETLSEKITANLCLVDPDILDVNVKDGTDVTPEYIEQESILIDYSGGKYQIKVGGEFDENPNAYFNMKNKKYLYKADASHVCFFTLREDLLGDCDGAKDEGIDDDCYKKWINNEDFIKCDECGFTECGELDKDHCTGCTTAQTAGCVWAEYYGTDNDECVNPNKGPALVVKINAEEDKTQVWDFRLTSNNNIKVGENEFKLDDFDYFNDGSNDCTVLAIEEEPGIDDDNAWVWYVKPGSIIEKRDIGRLWDGLRLWTGYCQICDGGDKGDFCVNQCGDDPAKASPHIGFSSSTIGGEWYSTLEHDKCGYSDNTRCPLLEEDASGKKYWKPKYGIVCDNSGMWNVCNEDKIIQWQIASSKVTYSCDGSTGKWIETDNSGNIVQKESIGSRILHIKIDPGDNPVQKWAFHLTDDEEHPMENIDLTRRVFEDDDAFLGGTPSTKVCNIFAVNEESNDEDHVASWYIAPGGRIMTSPYELLITGLSGKILAVKQSNFKAGASPYNLFTDDVFNIETAENGVVGHEEAVGGAPYSEDTGNDNCGSDGHSCNLLERDGDNHKFVPKYELLCDEEGYWRVCEEYVSGSTMTVSGAKPTDDSITYKCQEVNDEWVWAES
ncbi:hypothetical protein CMO94_02050 [Candidatus Woesearchaeota archaeon]|nr:hypothetical protein [Candidatus Woesearchaeota archaeon]